jgi:hypothetical protein
LADWYIGVCGYWSVGVDNFKDYSRMEEWSNGIMQYSNIPVFQYFSISVFHSSLPIDLINN